METPHALLTKQAREESLGPVSFLVLTNRTNVCDHFLVGDINYVGD
jgi:hypothetical protein